ncbi:MAG: FAD-binding oxidoreductase [Thermostichus sp. DG02_5_bins_236]
MSVAAPNQLQALCSALTDIEIITDPAQVTKLSLDFYHYSPVLSRQLSDKRGDLVVRPANEAEVIRVAAACAQQRIPVTIRGAGTGNYGQCIPLAGGVILDMSKLNQVLWAKPGVARVQAGAKLMSIDKQIREMLVGSSGAGGWEIRMAPSTYRTATIGGFIAGGSGGIGSITYGQLRDRGNVLGLRVVTLEEEPRIIELRGDEVFKVSHAWGLNGIITEVEIPLGPAYPWAELIVAFPSEVGFIPCAHFGQALADADGILKKMISLHAWPIPSYFAPLRGSIPEGSAVALLMIAESSVEPLMDLIREHSGQVIYHKTAQEASKGIMLGEFTWNHTTLHCRSVDPSLTYLQSAFPTDRELKMVQHMYEYFGDEVLMHLEFIRIDGQATPVGLQIVRFTTEDRLNEIMRYHEDNGVFIANPHTFIIEDGGRKVMDPRQIRFKEVVDPYGLLNPGKMRTWQERASG